MRGHAGELGGERGPDRTGKDEDEARRMDSEEQGDSARTVGVTRERPREGEGSREYMDGSSDKGRRGIGEGARGKRATEET